MVRILIASALLLCSAEAQTHDWTLSAAARGIFTTSSRIYPNPDAVTNELRTLNTPFSSILSGGIEVRAKWLDDDFFFYLSTEFFSESESTLKLNGSLIPPRRVPTVEGFRVVPVEFGMQVYVPIGSRSWSLSMGGGVGGYFTERILQIADVKAKPVGSPVGFGIHVAIHAEYRFLPGVSAIASMKFRDPEIDVRNKFETTQTIYENNTLTLPAGEIKSRINVDGMTLGLGILVEIR